MPPKYRHGKTAQDYRAALIEELDAVPGYRRCKSRPSLLLLIWLLVPVALLLLNWLWLQRWLHSVSVAELSFKLSKTHAPGLVNFIPAAGKPCLFPDNYIST
ncbi:hypothetical protein [Pseudomonas oryzihabitans]|uniref:hypothetical protein n=1 Tax=Pseudomonas oryzihabitans TaxID=47885 RepID=UPI002B1E3C46|nr:hypothetical protein [Pseudomonas oryzihabitans]